ncbi:MAG: hypothetical protein ACR2M3_12675 [Thermomicrobiales bacterium]
MAAQREMTPAIPETPEAPATRTGLGRRGLIAAAAAFVAGIAMKGATDPERVSANGGTWQMPYSSLLQNTPSTLATFLNIGTGTAVYGTSTGYGLYGSTAAATNSGYAGVFGIGNGTGTYGVYGDGADAATGVIGASTSGFGTIGNSSSYIGVYGVSNGGYGVYGASNGYTGVYGTNSSGYGVTGQTTATPPASNTPAASGVQGIGNGANTAGVIGSGNGAGIGVFGSSSSNIGVYGISGGGSGQPYGVVGAVNSAPGFGLIGVTNVAGTVGFAGAALVSGAIAGQFAGPVNIYNGGGGAPGNLYIQGNYTASGTKSAAVPHPDGTHRLLYCVESPEAWFEDFGEGTINGGNANVTLDADFAAVVDTSKLHVFVTPHDTTHHLAVTARAGSGFSVGAAPSTTAAPGTKASDLSGTFSYRVVAKRKDVAAPRLAKFDLPQEIKAAAPLVIPTVPKDEKKPANAVVAPPPSAPEPPKVDKDKQG